MGLMVRIADALGFFNKAKRWLQGKKTYIVNTIQAIGGLIAILALAGQFLDLLAKSLALLLGWSDGSAGGDVMAALKALWANHAILAAGFSAAWYTILDAFSKMTDYAAANRRTQALLTPPAAAPGPDAIPPKV